MTEEEMRAAFPPLTLQPIPGQPGWAAYQRAPASPPRTVGQWYYAPVRPIGGGRCVVLRVRLERMLTDLERFGSGYRYDCIVRTKKDEPIYGHTRLLCDTKEEAKKAT